MCQTCQPTKPPAFDAPEVAKRALEIEAEYQAALEAARSTPSLASTEGSEADDSVSTMDTNEEPGEPAVGQVTKQIDDLVSDPGSSTSARLLN